MSQQSFFSLKELCEREHIELRGAEGKPYCCDELMSVRSGMIGPDYARCNVCGKEIGNIASPHINGGYIPSKEWVAIHGEKTWCAANG